MRRKSPKSLTRLKLGQKSHKHFRDKKSLEKPEIEISGQSHHETLMGHESWDTLPEHVREQPKKHCWLKPDWSTVRY